MPILPFAQYVALTNCKTAEDFIVKRNDTFSAQCHERLREVSKHARSKIALCNNDEERNRWVLVSEASMFVKDRFGLPEHDPFKDYLTIWYHGLPMEAGKHEYPFMKKKSDLLYTLHLELAACKRNSDV